jgi:hypothetical protein
MADKDAHRVRQPCSMRSPAQNAPFWMWLMSQLLTASAEHSGGYSRR